MMGALRREIRADVEALLTDAKREGWSALMLRRELVVEMKDAPVRSHARRVWREELRRAGAPLRNLPNFAQTSFAFEAAS